MNLPPKRDGAYVYLVKGTLRASELPSLRTDPPHYGHSWDRILREQGIPVLLPNKRADGLYQSLVDTLFHGFQDPERAAALSELAITDSRLLGWTAFPLVVQRLINGEESEPRPLPDAFPETTATAQVMGKKDRER